MINETLAARQWPGDDPIGKRIAWAGELEGDDPWRTVIAVVGDVRHRGPMVEAAPEVYMPFEQAPDRRMTWLVRTTSDPMAVLPAVRRIVADVDPNLPVRRPRAMEAAIGESLSAVRAGAIAIAGLSAFALLLATVGLYGVLSFLVARRTAEFGVRIAFGASVRDIERQVLLEGLTTVGMAVLVGFALAWGAERLLRGTLAGMAEPSMPMLVVIAVLVLGTATVASWLPARRAARLDPATALLVD
jgi:putative ABC transport system permease protein